MYLRQKQDIVLNVMEENFIMNQSESKTLKNLLELTNGSYQNYWSKETLQVNSTYNDLIWNYWHYFDGFPDKGYLHPNELSSFTGIDRAIRSLPGRIKSISEAERMRKYYGSWESKIR